LPLDTTFTSARQELAHINEQIALAVVERDAAQEQINRLEAPHGQQAEVAQEHVAEKLTYDAVVVAWYTNGCPGARPELSTRMLDLERQIGVLRRNIDPIEAALQKAQGLLQAANERLTPLRVARRLSPIGSS
jgi:hypothetical protein